MRKRNESNDPGKNVFNEKGIDKKLHNLLSFEDFEKTWKTKEQKSTKRTSVGLDIVEEEFNPLRREDWKKAGTSIRRGAGFLNPEEELEEGKKRVLNHPVRKRKYQELLARNPEAAEAYLRFWSKEDDNNANPVWDSGSKKFVDKSKRYMAFAPGAAGN